MKNSPKNFYNVVDKKKLGIDEAVAVAGDVAELKVIVEDPDTGLVKTVADLKEVVDNIDYDISRKADIDGTYPDLTAGHAQNAEQLDSTVLVEDSEPYIFRTSGGSKDIGNRETDQLVGCTYAFNQLVGADTSTVLLPDTDIYIARISSVWSMGTSDGTTALSVTGGSDMVFDLTVMMGATLASYILGKETDVAGTGISFFRKLFPKDYYEYNAGELISVKASAHVMVGFNAYDHVSGEAKLVGGNQYQITGTYTALAYEDLDGNAETITPDSSGLFTPTKSGILTVTGGNDTDTCVHLTWTGYRNGEFEPYVKRSYTLDSDIELLGKMEIDSNDVLKYVGDTYSADGTVIRSWGSYTFTGNESWDESSTSGSYSMTLTGAVSHGYTKLTGAKIAGLVEAGRMQAATPDMRFCINSSSHGANKLFVKVSSVTSASGMASYMQGKTIVYSLAESVSESADSFQDPQWVDDFGTEEYVDTRSVPVPVGHNTSYPANLRDKLQHLPEPTGVDGTYLIREENEKMTLVPDQIPSVPTSDGTYVLTCTVTDGTATIAWTSNA